ncbi:hypothetical protein STEG23_009764 [Scotinomys teguina]
MSCSTAENEPLPYLCHLNKKGELLGAVRMPMVKAHVALAEWRTCSFKAAAGPGEGQKKTFDPLELEFYFFKIGSSEKTLTETGSQGPALLSFNHNVPFK